jgi:16S rRNA (cytosine967-C5)-methyltransferase
LAKPVKPRASSPDARALAWTILQRVEAGAYADALLGRQLHTCGLTARDQGLVTRLVYGTLAWQGYLDHIVAAFSRRPPQDLDAAIRTLLRLALCQICVLTRIPPFAAVDTAVNLAKKFRGGAASFVNAVLRRAASGWQQVQFPSPVEDPCGHLALRLSHPRWLVERWVAQYGLEETEALLRANNEPAPTVLRANRRRIEPAELLRRLREAGYGADPTKYSPVGIAITAAGPPESIPGYDDGQFSLQGEASQLVGFLAGARPGERVLDACAAPGGKATHLAELMNDQGQILALDTNVRGIQRVERMARRLGLSIVQTTVGDAAADLPLPTGEQCDCVLVDAPCSGLGTLREHPEIKWRRTPEDIAASAALQGRLLLNLEQYVRPGGTLVYATCTLSVEENDDVLAAFLRARSAFTVDDPRPFLPRSAHALIAGDDTLRTFPHQQALDGFFAVRLKRRGSHGIVRP